MGDMTADHVIRNRAAWNAMAADYVERGRSSWAAEPNWGVWSVPETDVRLLPEVGGLDTVELGCGTGYISGWLKRLGARPVGIDNSPRQLATARLLQAEHGVHFPLIQADAERTPLRDASYDLAISEYGAAIWCDPYRWIPEAARLLRPNGWLIILVNSMLHMLTVPADEGPADETLKRDYFGMHRVEWPDEEGIEFHLGYGDWIRLLRRCGFSVENLVELRPPEGTTEDRPYMTAEWARRWPTEEVWVARRI